MTEKKNPKKEKSPKESEPVVKTSDDKNPQPIPPPIK